MRNDRQRGFALAMALWLVAGLAVIAAMVSRFALRSAETNGLLREYAQAEVLFVTARADVLNLLSTSQTTVEGRTAARRLLRVDSSPYATGDGSFVAIQDGRGLININRQKEVELTRLLQHCGATEQEAPRLLATLLDYTDADDLHRINGAERDDYARAGLPPPTNQPLRSVQELWSILSWSTLQARWVARGCNALVSALPEPLFNHNTAPLAALTINGWPDGYAAALIAERDAPSDEPRVVAKNFAAFSMESNPFATSASGVPGSAYLVKHWHVNGTSLQYWVQLTRLRGEPPWTISDVLRSKMPPGSVPTITKALPRRLTTDPPDDPQKIFNPFGGPN